MGSPFYYVAIKKPEKGGKKNQKFLGGPLNFLGDKTFYKTFFFPQPEN